MQKIDLRVLPDEKTARTYDVCIVGAGAAGIYLANRLALQGNRVVVLEAGGDSCLPGSAVDIEAGFLADAYGGVLAGRAFGLGGTTSLWGGQLLPYSVYDDRGKSTYAEVWAHVIDIVQRYSKEVYAALDLGEDGRHFSLAQEYLGDRLAPIENAELAALVSDWLPFGRRNLRYMLERPGASKGSIDVFINAVAASWNAGQQSIPSARVNSVIARSINGRELHVSAAKFVIAAGAIESARILLELFMQAGMELVSGKRAIGHYLSDHLSAPIATVAPVDRKQVSLMFGPRFRNGRMRTLRFVDARADEARPKGFFHFVFLQENPGFHLARKILGGIQARKIPELHVSEILGGVRGLMGLAYSRYLKNRLFIPTDTPIQLQFDIEQNPCRDNRLSLSEERDGYGRFKCNIHWRVTREDYVSMEYASRMFLNRWPYQNLGMSALIPTNSTGLETKLYDTYHPVGTCRMGEDAEAVVDNDLQVHGLDNVYLVSTGIFPSAGTANPTFSLLCFAEALAVGIGKMGK